MDNLAGRTAFVTGAASGIGRGIARQLARVGVNVALVDIRADALADAAAQVESLGVRTATYVVDVSDRASIEVAAVAAERDLGPIAIACNNAGIAMHGVPLEAVAASDWDWVIAVNIYGVIHGIQTFVPRMRARSDGHIVNTASVGGLRVNPNFHAGPYSMTKFAVVALSEALEIELDGSGIGVSVLCPAAVDTELHLSERSRPDRLGGPTVRPGNHVMADVTKGGLAADAIGMRVVDAIRSNTFYILTHPGSRPFVDRRMARIAAAFDALESTRVAGWGERTQT